MPLGGSGAFAEAMSWAQCQWAKLMSLFDPSYDLLQRILKELKLHTLALEQLKNSQPELLNRLARIARKLPPSRPGWLTILNLKGMPVANIITFDVGLPALAPSHDVVNRELSISEIGRASCRERVYVLV